MSGAQDFLVEIGTEELPPKALHSLMLAFAENVERNLVAQRLAFSDVKAYASPRRLAVIVTDLADSQEAREITSKGPPVSVAFNADGNATPAANAFAKKCGVSIDKLGRSSSDKGEWLSFTAIEAGASSAELLPGCITAALEALPVPRRMRWGDSEVEFVRPVHWVVMLHGKKVVACEILGFQAGKHTKGHRFLAPDMLTVKEPGAYLALLEHEGFVIADFAVRRAIIEASVEAAATECGGTAMGSDALYEEVTALNEWPVALTGHFDASFLELPREVIVATLTGQQRYFSIAGPDGELLPAFVAIANLVSTDPEQVKRGNERVIQARLADAAFFWKADHQHPLEHWQEALKGVVYQRGLGSLFEKSARVAALAEAAATEIDADTPAVARAAMLAKCDLVAAMVGEFPELQGIMGRYYAQASGESGLVCAAIGEQYLPRFAGDALPVSDTSCCLAIADKLDSLCGVFVLGKKPSGNRDPFGLRRSALGLARIVIERELNVNINALIETAVGLQPPAAGGDVSVAVYDFIIERMRGYFHDRYNIGAEVFDAVRERRPASLLDFDRRIRAVASFVTHDAAASLAAANKRIGNILRKANYAGSAALVPSLLVEGAEKALHDALSCARDDIKPLLRQHLYTDVLARLATLRSDVDRFFDEVMVMDEDAALRENRLILLAGLRAQFLEVADISRLSIGKG